MIDAFEAADIFVQAAELNRHDPLLVGSTLVFPDYGQLVMTGDIHGHRRNYERLVKYCDLERAAVRHVILHELIDAELQKLDDVDTTHRLLLDAARWKTDFPSQVHFLQSNHDLAHLTGHDITKAGRSVIEAFEQGVTADYGPDNAPRVLDAINEFIRSFALAGRTPNRIFLAHSLPGPRDIDNFDTTVFDRTPTDADLAGHGSAHALVWGRNQTADVLDRLASLLDVDLFITGHQPQESGYGVYHARQVILASDHNHGMFLPFDLKRSYTLEQLLDQLVPCAALA